MSQPRRTTGQERWLRFFNTVGYNALAPVYNAMDWLTLGAWWRLVRRALEFVPAGGSVLEVGFGPGKLHTELAKQADFCIGLDYAWGMCRHTRQRLTRHDLPAHITQGSVFNLPYPANAYDTIVTTFAFSGFPNGPDALHEMTRVLKPGGQLVIVDIGLPLDGNRSGTFWASLWEKMGDFLYDIPALMAESGLTITTFEEYGPGKHIRVVVGQK